MLGTSLAEAKLGGFAARCRARVRLLDRRALVGPRRSGFDLCGQAEEGVFPARAAREHLGHERTCLRCPDVDDERRFRALPYQATAASFIHHVADEWEDRELVVIDDEEIEFMKRRRIIE